MKKILVLLLVIFISLIISGYADDLIEDAMEIFGVSHTVVSEGTTENIGISGEKYVDYEPVINNAQESYTVSEATTAAAQKNTAFDADVEKMPADIIKKADAISAKYGAVAVQLAVMENGKLKYTYEYGYANAENKVPVAADTKFRIASLSKFVTDVVFMCLCDTGAASVDEDVSKYFGYQVRNPDFPDVVITPAMLMSHIGSVVDSDVNLSSIANLSSQTMQSLLQSPSTYSVYEPGTFYSYSNFSVAAVAAMAEKISGKFFNELAKEYLFRPLQLDATFLASELKDKNKIATLYGDGGLTVERQLAAAPSKELGQTHHLFQGNLMISAKDYLEIISVICNGGVSDMGERIISKESIADILRSRLTIDYNYGTCIGCEENKVLVENKTVYVHTGVCYGMVSGFAFDPVTGNGIVILTSGSNAVYVDEKGLDNINVEFTDLLFPKS